MNEIIDEHFSSFAKVWAEEACTKLNQSLADALYAHFRPVPVVAPRIVRIDYIDDIITCQHELIFLCTHKLLAEPRGSYCCANREDIMTQQDLYLRAYRFLFDDFKWLCEALYRNELRSKKSLDYSNNGILDVLELE